MKEITFIALMLLTIILPLALWFKQDRTRKSFQRSLAVNAVGFFSLLLIATVMMFSGAVSASDPAAPINGLALIGAAIPTAGSSIGAGIATGHAAAAALGALSEDPKMFGKALIFVAMAEGIALYGLLISFFILSKIG
ncbi:MAG: ATP synthase subunit C [Eubacteriales bacterium]|nr:ATP synthase subunit C [Eubacteriales bacterium]